MKTKTLSNTKYVLIALLSICFAMVLFMNAARGQVLEYGSLYSTNVCTSNEYLGSYYLKDYCAARKAEVANGTVIKEVIPAIQSEDKTLTIAAHTLTKHAIYVQYGLFDVDDKDAAIDNITYFLHNHQPDIEYIQYRQASLYTWKIDTYMASILGLNIHQFDTVNVMTKNGKTQMFFSKHY